MEQQGYSAGNLWRNLSGKEKLGFGLGVLIIIGLIVVLAFMVFNSAGEEKLEPGTETEESYVNEWGDVVTKKTTVNEDGDVAVTETKEDEWGNVTTVDPDLITTYFPYQVAREHKEWMPTLKYYLYIDEENNKLIHASIEECDEEGDKALVQEYINSIPLDMSEYKVEFETFSDDADCGE